MEMKVDGMKNEVKRVQNNSTAELEQILLQLAAWAGEKFGTSWTGGCLEEQVTHLVQSLQNIIYHSHDELSSMTDNMHKAVVRLVTDRPAGCGNARNQDGGEEGTIVETVL